MAAARASLKGLTSLTNWMSLESTAKDVCGCPHIFRLYIADKTIAVFHHDGPFDACNPHRNVKKDRRAPMEAFPANSANMALGGAGPLNSRIDLDRFHGRGEEAFDAFASTRKTEPNIIDPTRRGDYVHGAESTGLGTSTFLDGAPASKRDITRRDSEEKGAALAGGGLTRKKSLAQRFRGMSNNRRGPNSEGRTPDARYHQPSSSNDNAIETSPPPSKSISAGGPIRAQMNYSKENEINPFENDYESAYARKGSQIRIAEQERPSAGRNLSSSSAAGPGRGLTRSITADGTRPGSNEGEKPSGGGFLSRMKSVGRRSRPERRNNDYT